MVFIGTTKVSQDGSIVLPEDLLEGLGIAYEDEVVLSAHEGSIVIMKVKEEKAPYAAEGAQE